MWGDARVTVFLRAVTLDEAMRVILSTQQLDRELLNDNTVLIYPNTAPKQRERHLAPAHVRHRRAALPLRWPPYHSIAALHPQRRRTETDGPWYAGAVAHFSPGHRASPADLRRLTDPPTLNGLRPPDSTCVDVTNFSYLRRPNSLRTS